MRKQGAIILGIGGDNSPWASGIFVSHIAATICRALIRNNVARAGLGVMTAGYASSETDAEDGKHRSCEV